MTNKSKVKIKESLTKKIDPVIVAKALGASEVTKTNPTNKIEQIKPKKKKKKDNVPKFDPKFFYADGWPKMPEFLIRRKSST